MTIINDGIGVKTLTGIDEPLTGYDIDGVLSAGIVPQGSNWVVISGRTRSEYDDFVKELASRAPVYIRCIGEYGDVKAASEWKATMVKLLKVSTFVEDDPRQAKFIKINNPECAVLLVNSLDKSCREVILTNTFPTK